MDKQITITMTEQEASECLRALIFRADELNEHIKIAGQKGNIDRVIQLSEMVKTMQNTMTKLQNAGTPL